MKIQICQISNPSKEYNIYKGAKKLNNVKSFMFPYDFTEEQIELILDNQYSKFNEGKFEFDIPNWKIDAIQGLLNPKTNEQLRFITQYSE